MIFSSSFIKVSIYHNHLIKFHHMAIGNTTSYSFEIEKMFNRADKKQAYYFQPAPKHLSTFQTGHCILPFMAIIPIYS